MAADTTCAACDGLRDGYLGVVRTRRVGAELAYFLGQRVGAQLRRDEWASGYRTRAMFDLDDPTPERFVPMIPQVAARG